MYKDGETIRLPQSLQHMENMLKICHVPADHYNRDSQHMKCRVVSSRMCCHIVKQKFTDVSPKYWWTSTRLCGETPQNVLLFVVIAVRTSSWTYRNNFVWKHKGQIKTVKLASLWKQEDVWTGSKCKLPTNKMKPFCEDKSHALVISLCMFLSIVL
jgi:hypothetical protein